MIDLMITQTILTILKSGTRFYSIEELQDRASAMIGKEVKKSDIERVISRNRNRFEIVNPEGRLRIRARQ